MQPSRKKGIAKLGNGCNKDAAQEKPSWERVATKMLNSCDQVDRWEQPRCRTGIAKLERLSATKSQHKNSQFGKWVQPKCRTVVTNISKGCNQEAEKL